MCVNIHLQTVPAFCRIMFAVGSPYPPTLVTALASFSQDVSWSVFSHCDIVSIMHLLAVWWSALIVFESKCCINCRPSSGQSPSENWALCRIFTTFFSSSCKAVKPVWKQRKVAHWTYFKQHLQGRIILLRLKSVQNHRTFKVGQHWITNLQAM